MAIKGQKFRNHSVNFKVMLAKKNIENSVSVVSLSEKFNISKRLIIEWRNRYLENARQGLEPRKEGTPNVSQGQFFIRVRAVAV